MSRLEYDSGIFTLEEISCEAAYVDPGGPTCITGSTIDWFLACPQLSVSAESKVEKYTPVSKHNPVRLNIGGELSDDM
eukprot:16433938-Heterocapsa_arctica.AAC.1